MEENAIREVLGSSEKKAFFEFESRGAVTKDLLIDHLLKIEPNILHISGHGNSDEQLLLEDIEGYKEEVSIEKLSAVLSGFTDHIDCVFLNTCHSLSGIGSFNKDIPYIVGMNNEIPDDVAINFSKNFYNVLFNGRTIKDAFKISLATIALSDNGDEHIPKLIVNKEAIKKDEQQDKIEEDVQNELVSTIVSEEEIEVAKNGYKKSVNFHYRLIYVAITLSIGLAVFLFISNDQDIASSLLGLIPGAFSSYPFLEIQKKKNRITLIKVFELKRKRLLNALSQLSDNERKELNEEFMRLIIV